MPKVFYDGTCPVCSREIGFYQRRGGDTNIDWVDIDTAPDADFPVGLTREDALARFHFVDRTGRLHDGAAAFAQLWAEMPRFRWLGRIAQFGPILFALERVYLVFLRLRTQRLP